MVFPRQTVEDTWIWKSGEAGVELVRVRTARTSGSCGKENHLGLTRMGRQTHGKLRLTESMARGGKKRAKKGMEGKEGTLAMVYSPNRRRCSHSLRGCAGDLILQADALRRSYVPALCVARKTSRCFGFVFFLKLFSDKCIRRARVTCPEAEQRAELRRTFSDFTQKVGHLEKEVQQGKSGRGQKIVQRRSRETNL